MNKVFEIVNERIIDRIKTGNFKDFSGIYTAILTEGPCNYETGRPYSWLNALLLLNTGKTPEFITYNGIKRLAEKYPEKDIHLNKGSHGYIVSIFTPWGSRTKKTDTKDLPDGNVKLDEDEKKPSWYFSYYRVFSIDDVTGLEPKWHKTEKRPEKTDEDCENLFQNYIRNEGIALSRINYGHCCYWPDLDKINLFADSGFKTADRKYKAAFHEMAHSTGHSKRLNRKLAGRSYGNEKDYSKEELTADLAAAYLMAEYRRGGLSQETEEETAFYLDNWLSVFQKDTKMLVYAMAAAEKAVAYIKEHAGTE